MYPPPPSNGKRASEKRISLLFVESSDFFHESPDFSLSGVGRSDANLSYYKEVNINNIAIFHR